MLYSLFRERKQQTSGPVPATGAPVPASTENPKTGRDCRSRNGNASCMGASATMEDFDSALEKARLEALLRETTTPNFRLKAKSQNTVEMSPGVFAPRDLFHRDGSEPSSFGVIRAMHSSQDESELTRRLFEKARSYGGSAEMLELSGRSNEVDMDSTSQSRELYAKSTRSNPSEDTSVHDGTRSVGDDYTMTNRRSSGGGQSPGYEKLRSDPIGADQSEIEDNFHRKVNNPRSVYINPANSGSAGVQNTSDLSSSGGESELMVTLRPSAGNSLSVVHQHTVLAAFIAGLRVRAALHSPEGKTLYIQIKEINELLFDIERSEKVVANSSPLPPAPTGPLVKQRKIWVEQLIALVHKSPQPSLYLKNFMHKQRMQHVSCTQHRHSPRSLSEMAENDRSGARGVATGFTETSEDFSEEPKSTRPRKMLRRGDGTRRIMQRSQEIIAKSVGDGIEAGPTNLRSKSTEERESVPTVPRSKTKKLARGNEEFTSKQFADEHDEKQSSIESKHQVKERAHSSSPAKEKYTPKNEGDELVRRKSEVPVDNKQGQRNELGRYASQDRSTEGDPQSIPSPYSSIEAEQRSRQIDAALRSVVLGPKRGTEKGGFASASGNLTASSVTGANVTATVSPQFLAERRAVFLQTLFREPTDAAGGAKGNVPGETGESRLFSIPRLDAKRDSSLFSANSTGKQSSSWFLSGGYHETRRALETLGL